MPTIKINLTQQELQHLHKNGELDITFGNNVEPITSIDTNVQKMTYFELISNRINQLKETGNLRTAETYRAALNQFSRFRNGLDLSLADVTPEVMEQFQAYLRNRNLTMNTVSFLMRILRSAYNRGVENGLVADCRPFKNVYTGNARTQKRALTLEQLLDIKKLILVDRKQAFARDMFLLSFFLRGMSFVDMAYIKHSDLHDGRLTYKRRKTGQMITIRWEQPMQDIVDRYPNPTGKYMLPIIIKLNGKERNQYRHRQTIINKELKEIGKMAAINVPLSMYCSRHTWATVARDLQVPMNVISRAMGHTNERTTEIYIRSIDINKIDKANEQIINSLWM